MTNFYTHRKTLRLKAKLGSDALWIPPRLWAYAAENQPDGVFGTYEPQEIAELIGYTGDAPAMLQALLQAGFLDDEPLRIHEWAEHNSYHRAYAERASKAAAARWAKHRHNPPPAPPQLKGKEKKVPDLKGKEPSIASSMLGASGAKASPPASKSKPQLSDEEWLAELANDPAYTGVDVAREHAKMIRWCKTRHKQPTRRRFIGWLNRAETPMQTTNRPTTKASQSESRKPLSVWEIKQLLEVKEEKLKVLAGRGFTDSVGLNYQPGDREEAKRLKTQVRDLKQKLDSMEVA